jgi:hypothetical protein
MSTTAPRSGNPATPPVSDSPNIPLTCPGVRGFDVSESKRTVCVRWLTQGGGNNTTSSFGNRTTTHV